MITVSTIYDYARDGWSVIAYDVDEDVLRSALEVERMHLEQLGAEANVLETENGLDSVFEVESGEEADAAAECQRLRREHGYAIVGPMGRLEI